MKCPNRDGSLRASKYEAKRIDGAAALLLLDDVYCNSCPAQFHYEERVSSWFRVFDLLNPA